MLYLLFDDQILDDHEATKIQYFKQFYRIFNDVILNNFQDIESY